MLKTDRSSVILSVQYESINQLKRETRIKSGKNHNSWYIKELALMKDRFLFLDKLLKDIWLLTSFADLINHYINIFNSQN